MNFSLASWCQTVRFVIRSRGMKRKVRGVSTLPQVVEHHFCLHRGLGKDEHHPGFLGFVAERVCQKSRDTVMLLRLCLKPFSNLCLILDKQATW